MVKNINQGWEFQKLPEEQMDLICDADRIIVDNRLFEPVDLPHTWYVDGDAYKGTVMYRKKIFLKEEAGKRIFLNFQAADRWCKVFVNGHYAGEHKGGYSAFTFDITEYSLINGENEIKVFLDNGSWNEISPLAGDFTVFGGLYRDVNLIITEQICFDRTYYGTNGVIVNTDIDQNDMGTIRVETHLMGIDAAENMELEYQVFFQGSQVAVSKTGTIGCTEQIRIQDPVLWNGTDGAAQYRICAELKAEGNVVDTVEMMIGFRSVSLDSEKGFFLNGIHRKLNGVAKHQDYAGVFGATREEHWLQDIKDIMDIGANSVRLSHYQHPQEMYRLCDEKGLIVWAEIPMLKMTENERAFDNACSQLKELILQNMHHPSICFWGIQNEIAMFGEDEMMYRRLERMNALVKTLDSTRICAGANLFCVKNGSRLNRVTEAVGYNIYFGWYYGEMKDSEDFVEQFHKDNPDVPLGITEYGADCNLAYHSEQPKVKDYSEEFQALYHETVYPFFRDREYIWGTYVWNLYDFSSEIRDEGGVKYKNCKGLVSYDRKIKKDAYYYYKAQWSYEPFVKIAQSRFINRVCVETAFTVYSNQKEVTLQVNEDCYVQRSDSGVFHFTGIRIENGINKIKADSGLCTDNIVVCGAEKVDDSYIYTDPDPGLNVKNWFTDIVEEEKIFPAGRLSIRETCKELLEYKEAMNVIQLFSPKLAEQMRERQSLMPLENILKYMKKEISDQQCRDLNAALTEISKWDKTGTA